jgi:LmbE family N-acetylglucosaminyl deacetylase
MAISRFTTEAVSHAIHHIEALYYMAWTQETIDLYTQAFGEIAREADGEIRRPVAWPDWAVDVGIDASAHWEIAWRAIACHRSQLPGYESLLRLPESYHRSLWSSAR